MADQGLQEAIRAVGGVTRTRAPHRHFAALGFELDHDSRRARARGRGGDRRRAARSCGPIFIASRRSARSTTSIVARAQEYALLAALLAARARRRRCWRASRLARRRDAARRRACRRLARPPASAEPSESSANIFDLFIGLGRGELLPYGSYYLTGFLHERPLARLRDDLAALGIERAEGNCEPEDHAAILCEIMAGLGERQPAGAAGRRPQMFEKHMAPWIGRFFADLERAEAATSTAASERSAACSWKSKRKLRAAVMRRRARKTRRRMAMKTKRQADRSAVAISFACSAPAPASRRPRPPLADRGQGRHREQR